MVVDLQWTDDSHFTLSGLPFYCSVSDYTRLTTEQEIILLKNKRMVEEYKALMTGQRSKNVLEFGIFEGGSAVLLTLLGNLQRFVGIDLRPPSPALAAVLKNHAVGQHISLHYRTNQGDREAVRRIVAQEFGTDPLDLIIDDGSHQYELTRSSLEASFGYLKPGGLYSIEDWGWAHWRGIWQTDQSSFAGRTPLSNLIFELVVAAASAPDIVARVDIRSNWQVVITRGPGLGHGAPVSLDTICLNRGRPMPLA